MMQETESTIIFTCPGCKESFEFDSVGEYQLVSCPICGIHYMTKRKEQTMQLQDFDFNTEDQAPEISSLMVEVR